MAQGSLCDAAGCRLDDFDVAQAAKADIPKLEARASLGGRKVERRLSCVQASTVRSADTTAA